MFIEIKKSDYIIDVKKEIEKHLKINYIYHLFINIRIIIYIKYYLLKIFQVLTINNNLTVIYFAIKCLIILLLILKLNEKLTHFLHYNIRVFYDLLIVDHEMLVFDHFHQFPL